VSHDPDATSVRTATADDLAGLSAFAARTFPLACPPWMSAASIADFVTEQLSEAAFAGHLADPDHHVLVAVDGLDEPVGYSLAIHGALPEAPEPWRAERTAYLSKLYVAPELHGAGLARTLMDAVRTASLDDGCVAIWLGTNRENLRAQRFYARCGFSVVAERRFDVGGTVCIDDVYGLRL